MLGYGSLSSTRAYKKTPLQKRLFRYTKYVQDLTLFFKAKLLICNQNLSLNCKFSLILFTFVVCISEILNFDIYNFLVNHVQKKIR